MVNLWTMTHDNLLPDVQMVMEEELKELKELNDDLQQKLSSAEEKRDNAMESHSKEIAKSNEKVLYYRVKYLFSHTSSHTPVL